MMGNVEISVTEFRLGQKCSVTLLLQFLTCVLNRVKFLYFFRLCVVGLQRPFTVKPNWVRGDCPFPSLAEGPINQGIHRLSHLCLPARGSGPPCSNSEFLRHKCIHQPHRVAASRQAASAIDGCDVPSLSACVLLSLRGKG